MLGVEIIVLAFAVRRCQNTLFPPSTSSHDRAAVHAPTALSPQDVLPTPTPDINQPIRMILFPDAEMSAPIIPAGRVGGTWETRHLGNSVGHLVGTSWLDEPGGNIVLAGHVENAAGEPGPFAHLFEAEIGDPIVIRDGGHEVTFRVVAIDRVPPDAVSYLAQDGRVRVTLITCTDWNREAYTYEGRLVVVAEP